MKPQGLQVGLKQLGQASIGEQSLRGLEKESRVGYLVGMKT